MPGGPSVGKTTIVRGTSIFACILRSETFSHDLGHLRIRAPQQIVSLFDHLVGALLQKPRYVEADRFRGLEIYHKLIFGWRLHRQVARLLAL
jgi:hypothetical protein